MISAKTILVLDTETVGLEGHVYDVGYAITNKRGDIALERNWLVEENFTDPKKMMGAFYAGKHFTHYARMLQDGDIRLTPWAEIVGTLRADMLTHGVDIIAAYNAGFDFRVLRQTHADLGGTAPSCNSRLTFSTFGNLLARPSYPKNPTLALRGHSVGFHPLATSRPARNLPIATFPAILPLSKITPP